MKMNKAFLLLVLAAACQSAARAGDSATAEAPGAAPAPSGGTQRADSLPATPAEAEVMITLDKTAYAAGAPVALNIMNHAADTLGFNPCNRTLERRDGSAWKPFDEMGRMCTMELWILKPHESRDAKTELPSPMPAGTYRMVIAFGAQKATPSGRSEGMIARSAAFEVR